MYAWKSAEVRNRHKNMIEFTIRCALFLLRPNEYQQLQFCRWVVSGLPAKQSVSRWVAIWIHSVCHVQHNITYNELLSGDSSLYRTNICIQICENPSLNLFYPGPTVRNTPTIIYPLCTLDYRTRTGLWAVFLHSEKVSFQGNLMKISLISTLSYIIIIKKPIEI